MIRYAKHHGINYIIVDSTLEIDDATLPVQVQINIESIKPEDYPKVFKVTSVAFNRTLSFNRPKVETKKNWLQTIFKL